MTISALTAAGLADGAPVAPVHRSHITRASKAWPRRQLDSDRVEMFKAVLAEDRQAVPPLICVDDRNGGFILADGHHRYEAHVRLGGGYEMVAVHVIAVPHGRAPVDYAYEVALACSAKSAKPLTRTERIDAADRLIAERPDLSDRAISRMTGVSPSTVGAHRHTGVQLDGNPTPSDGDPSEKALHRAARNLRAAGKQLGKVEDNIPRRLARAFLEAYDGDRDTAIAWARWWQAAFSDVRVELGDHEHRAPAAVDDDDADERSVELPVAGPIGALLASLLGGGSHDRGTAANRGAA